MARNHVLTLKVDEDAQDIRVSSSSYEASEAKTLHGWILQGFVPVRLTGNGERDFGLTIQRRWDDMKKYAILTLQEDGKKVSPQARSKETPGLPDKWDESLQAWIDDGWDLKFFSGNREHGWGAVLCKES